LYILIGNKLKKVGGGGENNFTSNKGTFSSYIIEITYKPLSTTFLRRGKKMDLTGD